MEQKLDQNRNKSRRDDDRGGQRRGRKGRRTKEMVGIAHERMELLMVQARDALRRGDIVKANRYAGLARGIGMRYNVRMRSEHRQLVCRKCGALMIPSKTSMVRIVRGRRIARCLKCGDIRRMIIKARAGKGTSEKESRSDEDGSAKGQDEDDEDSS